MQSKFPANPMAHAGHETLPRTPVQSSNYCMHLCASTSTLFCEILSAARSAAGWKPSASVPHTEGLTLCACVCSSPGAVNSLLWPSYDNGDLDPNVVCFHRALAFTNPAHKKASSQIAAAAQHLCRLAIVLNAFRPQCGHGHMLSYVCNSNVYEEQISDHH
jgi:hypothetical protein